MMTDVVPAPVVELLMSVANRIAGRKMGPVSIRDLTNAILNAASTQDPGPGWDDVQQLADQAVGELATYLAQEGTPAGRTPTKTVSGWLSGSPTRDTVARALHETARRVW